MKCWTQQWSLPRDSLSRSILTGQGILVYVTKNSRFRLDIRRNSLLWRCWGSGSGYPEKLCMSHPWKCSGSGLMRPWAAWSRAWQPCLLQGVETGWTLRSLPTQAVLWLYWLPENKALCCFDFPLRAIISKKSLECFLF